MQFKNKSMGLKMQFQLSANSLLPHCIYFPSRKNKSLQTTCVACYSLPANRNRHVTDVRKMQFVAVRPTDPQLQWQSVAPTCKQSSIDSQGLQFQTHSCSQEASSCRQDTVLANFPCPEAAWYFCCSHAVLSK